METSLIVAVVLGWVIGQSRGGMQNTDKWSLLLGPVAGTKEVPVLVDSSGEMGIGAVGEVPDETVERESTNAEIHEDCHEHVEKPNRLHWRAEWDRDEMRESRDSVDLIVVRDGGIGCSRMRRCRALVRSLRGRRKNCELRDNFYVGGDGNVFEGRGWRAPPYWHLRGLTAVTVHFLGAPPSARALEAYQWLVDDGLFSGRLSAGHAVIAMATLLNDTSHSSRGLQDAVSAWPRATDVARLSRSWEYVLPRHLRLVRRAAWDGEGPASNRTRSRPLPRGVAYVMISEGGERCRGRVQCTAFMTRERQEWNAALRGDLPHNFYVTDGGDVFEGRGWEIRSQWELKHIGNSYVSVQLCGNFTSDAPSEEAVNALKLLVASGVEGGRLSPRYKLVSIGRLLHAAKGSLGEGLQKYVEGWSAWYRYWVGHGKKPLAFIERDDWDDRSSSGSHYGQMKMVVVVVVDDGGERCYTREECIPLIKEKQFSGSDTVIYNYYIGGDGYIYEGSGRLESQVSRLFSVSNVMAIRFLGSFSEDRPSALAIGALTGLLDYAKSSGFLYRQYKLTSFRETYRTGAPSPARGLDGYLSTLPSWTSYSTLKADLFSSDRIPFRASRLDYQSSVASNFTRAVDYVVIGELRDTYCLYEIRYDCLSGKANFYINEYGRSFEYRGWKYPSLWERKALKTEFYSVVFSGNFTESLPSRLAIMHFHHLVRFGVEAGKLAADYKILTFRQIAEGSLESNPGDKFWQEIRTWDRWTEIDPLPL
ncbi:uncharacterized protein LOC124155420 isoform X1 [Ischnura elegans]|uniref:uncharacterized protein LOC124155420 isoform X1 n=1 Tax=Ischnura elegans TaxID=197161 RepID=UPI001ED890B9|nr:uncharacterized protein LOC124155420 isoform X1 [Ischnura elegans]XP_046385170.1 uncharacterized protein LOC124155420 isoform X1 [Ischnura elegans]